MGLMTNATRPVGTDPFLSTESMPSTRSNKLQQRAKGGRGAPKTSRGSPESSQEPRPSKEVQRIVGRRGGLKSANKDQRKRAGFPVPGSRKATGLAGHAKAQEAKKGKSKMRESQRGARLDKVLSARAC